MLYVWKYKSSIVCLIFSWENGNRACFCLCARALEMKKEQRLFSLLRNLVACLFYWETKMQSDLDFLSVCKEEKERANFSWFCKNREMLISIVSILESRWYFWWIYSMLLLNPWLHVVLWNKNWENPNRAKQREKEKLFFSKGGGRQQKELLPYLIAEAAPGLWRSGAQSPWRPRAPQMKHIVHCMGFLATNRRPPTRRMAA